MQTIDRTENRAERQPDRHRPDGSGPEAARGRRRLTTIGFVAGAIVGLVVLIVAYSSLQTERDIRDLRAGIVEVGLAEPSPVYDPAIVADLPAPVRRYFDFTFVGTPRAVTHVEFTMAGDFRRPLTDGFSPTTAEQTVAVGTPGLMFSARTELFAGLWARAYDSYEGGRMEMKAKVLSTITVVDETETPELNQTSLQRWLLESPMYPAALLPGGPVRWEAIDDNRARAVVTADGTRAALVATFRSDGSLESFQAETDGDLTTPYHGSGEHVLREDYRPVDGVMIPHRFTISRAADGERFPFWVGEVESITMHTVDG